MENFGFLFVLKSNLLDGSGFSQDEIIFWVNRKKKQIGGSFSGQDKQNRETGGGSVLLFPGLVERALSG